ncbi:MAG: histidinol phosphate phosphatase domain-containing protein [Deltaproteobacteria bacterium]|nr:histidinol phosphate phosphatase domain-containing protein [Deltaproteobacteria bacterium]
MIDLHTHTVFSDGELIPAELARRAEVIGITALGITDHGDFSNLDFIIPRMIAVAEILNKAGDFKVIPGIEITHVPPALIKRAVDEARRLGAEIVVMHGETVAEPVAPGTNRAAILAGVDVLAHPGLLSHEDAELARDRGVLLEISGRRGHCLTNGHVARMAQATGAKMVVDSDGHAPGDLMNEDRALTVVLGAGLSERDFSAMQENAARLIGMG